MARYQATIAYDGTAYRGFQAQPGFRTVEGELRSALGRLGRQDEPLLAGGRTDAGVHAAGQVIAFDLAWRHPAEELQRALNALLPDDIACPALGGAAEDFHPRYHALKRCYRYRVITAPWPDPLRERYALRVWPEPDVDRMASAARDLLGKKDFGAFGSAPREGSHTVRTILRADWLRKEDALEFWVEADAFLFRMVRTIAATLLQIGSGSRTSEAFRALFAAPPRGRAAPLAPAHGLCLMKIEYPGGGQG